MFCDEDREFLKHYGEAPLVLIEPTRVSAKLAAPLASIDKSYYEAILNDIENRR